MAQKIAQKDDDLDLDAEKKTKSGGGAIKIVLFSLLAIVLVGGSILTTVLVMGSQNSKTAQDDASDDEVKQKSEEKTEKDKKKKKKKKSDGDQSGGKKTPHYLELEKPVVVNLSGSTNVRFLQITVALMTYKEADIEVMKKHMPVIRHNLVLLFSSINFTDLQSIEGKKKLQDSALNMVREELTKLTGGPVVDGLYLPSIIGQ